MTEKDNGMYTLKIESPSGHKEERDIMLEVITNYTDDKWTQWMDKIEKDRYVLPGATSNVVLAKQANSVVE